MNGTSIRNFWKIIAINKFLQSVRSLFTRHLLSCHSDPQIVSVQLNFESYSSAVGDPLNKPVFTSTNKRNTVISIFDLFCNF